MRNYLRFLKPYEVNIRMDLSVYLKKANLTAKEREMIQNSLKSFELVYIVKFSSGEELFVILADLVKWDSKYIERNVVSAIAHSFSYSCMIALRNGKAVRFFVFDRRENQKDYRRSAIDKVYWSPIILFDRGSAIDQMVQTRLKSAFLNSRSAEDITNYLKNAFKDIRTIKNKLELYQEAVSTFNNQVHEDEPEDECIYQRDCYSCYEELADIYEDDKSRLDYSDKLQILIYMFDLIDIMMSDNAEIMPKPDQYELEEHQYYIYKLNDNLQEIYDYLAYHRDEFETFLPGQDDMYLSQISLRNVSDEEYDLNLEEKYQRRFYIHECSALLEEAFAEYPYTYPLDYPELPGMKYEVETIDRLSQLIHDMSYF